MINPLHIALEIAANLAMRIGPVRDWRLNRGRTTLRSMPDQVHLILRQFDFYINGIGLDRIQNRIVLEVGPGDSIPHGMLFLGAGAKQYIAVDRFFGNFSSQSAKIIYSILARSAPAAAQQRWKDIGLDPECYPWLGEHPENPPIRIIRRSIEEIDPAECGNVDLILSFNVVEHLLSIPAAFRKLALVLTESGLMLHRVDYGPHNFWVRYENPLSFLTISAFLWSLMGSHRGYPNRLRHCQILAALRDNGFTNSDRVIGIVREGAIQEIRSALPKNLGVLNDAALAALDAEILSSKNSCLPSEGNRPSGLVDEWKANAEIVLRESGFAAPS